MDLIASIYTSNINRSDNLAVLRSFVRVFLHQAEFPLAPRRSVEVEHVVDVKRRSPFWPPMSSRTFLLNKDQTFLIDHSLISPWPLARRFSSSRSAATESIAKCLAAFSSLRPSVLSRTSSSIILLTFDNADGREMSETCQHFH